MPDPGGPPDSRLPDISRRTLLGGAGIAAIALAIPGSAEAVLRSVAVPTGARPTVTFTLRERTSLQRIGLSLYNVALSEGRFAPTGAGRAMLVVDVGPQALVEEIVSGTRPVAPVGARLALPSRLAFDLPADGLPATRAGLLDWLGLTPRVGTLAGYPDGAIIPPADAVYADPAATQTALEMPWHVVLSPNRDSAWEHRVEPVTRGGRTEVWQTRLATRVADGSRSPSGSDRSRDTVRVVWLRDPRAAARLSPTPPRIPQRPGRQGFPFPMLPTPQDRSDIGRLSGMTSDRAGTAAVLGGAAAAIPASIALSALGGSMTVLGAWNEPGVSSLTSWQQRAWNGRDTYVRTTRVGFLYPFAAPAVLQTEMVREFAADSRGVIRAFERQVQRVLVTSPEIDLDGANGVPFEGRGTPLRSVRFDTLTTPEVSRPSTPLGGQWAGLSVFVPEVSGGEPFSFAVTGIDRAGRSVAFSMPMLFAEDAAVGGNRANFTRRGMRDLTAFYNGLPAVQRRADVGGRYLAFAPGSGGADMSTALPTVSIDWAMSVGSPSGSPASLARTRRSFGFPALERADVTIDGVSAMAGDSQSVSVSFPDVYLRGGIDATSLGIYLEGISAETVGVDVQRAGGISAPSIGLAGIGRATGVLPGPPGIPAAWEVAGSVDLPRLDPAAMLGDITLFGGIALADLLPDGIDMLIEGPDGSLVPNPKAPAFLTDRTLDVDLPDVPLEVEVTYTWRPDLTFNSAAGDFIRLLLPLVEEADFYVTVTAKASALTQEAYWRAEGVLSGLLINFIGDTTFASVRLERFGFTAGSDRPQDLQVEIGDVVFGDALAFLSTLSRFLSFGPGNGPILDIDSRSITTGFSLAVPEVTLGAVGLTGLSTRVAIALPFGDDPVRFSLAFSSPDDPFAVTIMGLGGGGWFGMDLGVDGVEYLNIGAAIRAALEIDLGVASGGVSCTIGLQYEITGRGDATLLELTAFVCVKGRVEVLGIVTIGIEICLGLTAQLPAPGERITLVGRATCTVKVKVCGLKKSVSITMKRTVTGGVMPEVPGRSGTRVAEDRFVLPMSDDITLITFADVMTQADWDEWCGAFA